MRGLVVSDQILSEQILGACSKNGLSSRKQREKGGAKHSPWWGNRLQSSYLRYRREVTNGQRELRMMRWDARLAERHLRGFWQRA